MCCLVKIFILLRFVTSVSAGNRDAYLENICMQQIQGDDEVHEPPMSKGEPRKPVQVFVKMKVIDIDEIDGANMDYRLHMYFRTFWNDTRLKNITIMPDCSAYIWTPDVMFETAKSIQSFDTTSTAFRVEKSGLVIMTERFSLKASCMMNFRYYPFDTQQCLFNIVFMRTFDAVAQLKWFDDESSPFHGRGKSVVFARKIEPLQYYIKEPTTHSEILRTSYANFTYLIANFTLVRRLTGSIFSIYLPSSLVVAVSWFTFWLKPEAAPARVSLSVTSLLTVCTQVQQYKAQLPPVNYITAMDIWLFVCIFFVFASLLEFAICYNAHIGAKDMKSQTNTERGAEEPPLAAKEMKMHSAIGGAKSRTVLEAIIIGGKEKLCTNCFKFRHCLNLDIYCRKYFPLSFFAFVVVYWAFYIYICAFKRQ